MQAQKYPSRPLPSPEFDPFIKVLAEVHKKQPFPITDPQRKAIERVGEIALSHQLTAKLMLGSVQLPGIAADSVWLAVGIPGESEVWVIDTLWPLNNDSFLSAIGSWVKGEKPLVEMQALAEESIFRDRVLGVYPKGVEYYGQHSWSED